jgi:PAS domain S-box-containing protein
MNTNKLLQTIRSGWSPLAVIAVTTIAVIAISIYCLASGYFIIFQNLFYIPIIIACVYYTKRGFAFSVVIACLYFLLTIAFTRESLILLQAFGRVLIFVLVAGVITYLSLARKRVEESLRRRHDNLEGLVQERTAQLEEDITGRKKKEEEFKSAKSFLDTVIDSSPFAMWISDREGMLIRTNRSLRETLNLTDEQLIGKYNVLNDANLEMQGVMPMVRAVFEMHTPASFIIPWKSSNAGDVDFKGGRDLYIDVSIFPILDKNGELTNAVCQWVNITERKQAEEELKKHRNNLEQLVKERTAELKKSEEKFRTLADFTYDWEYWLDPERRMLYISPSCERITGFPPASFYKEPQFINTIIHPDDRQSFENHVGLYHVGNKHSESDEREFRIVDRNGGTKWIAHVCAPITGEGGAYLGRRVSNRDITERKVVEKELNRRSVELEAANRELESFAYSVSHDLRAPLRTIDGFSQIIIDDYSGKLDEQGKNYLLRVKSATQRMGQLIDDILKLSRITRQELKREETDLSMMARKISAELSHNQPERQVEFVIKPGCVEDCDRQLIGIALENLIGNSWKYSSRHTSARIEFGTTEKDGKTVYFVRDDGAGFDPAYADKLFSPFQRLHAASEFEGNGIGLATIQRIVRKHGGSVWAEGQVEKGATFYFTLT